MTDAANAAPAPGGDTAGRLAAALERIGNAARSLLRAAAAAEGVSITQAQVLLRLHATPDEQQEHGSAAIARWLEVSTPTVSDALASLEGKRLVRRATNTTDARRVEVVMTRAGAGTAARLSGWDAPLREALVTAVEEPGVNASRLAMMLDQSLRTIAALQRAGVVSVARTCRGCRFFDSSGVPGSPYWCNLLGSPLEPATLRVDCPEYDAS